MSALPFLRSSFLPFLIALLLPACSALPSEEPPVADSTLVQVLVELHLAEARTNVEGAPQMDTRQQILARYDLSEECFRAAMDYYAEHPQEYVDLYNAVLDQFNEERYGQTGIDTLSQ